MKRVVLILALAVFLITSPAFAKQNETKNNSKKADVKVEQTCDTSDFWKNHGQYVSCVAKLRQGGVVVSAAAKSEISKLASESLLGKKPKASPIPEVSPLPSASPSSTPSASPSPSVSPSPSLSPEPAGGPSPLNALNASKAELEVKALIEVLKSIIVSLQNLMLD